jgi:type I restriction enzyme M protein
MEDETGEFNPAGNPVIKKRKADDEYLIRHALLDARLIDAVISLPLNIFYGAGVPACLVILRKNRPKERRDQVLLVYAARHYRELSAQNELRPQDVMRLLVHYHSYGDSKKVAGLVDGYSGLIRRRIDLREEDEVGRLMAESEEYAERLLQLDEESAAARVERERATTKRAITGADVKIARLEKQREKPLAKLVERDERIAEARRLAAEDRQDVVTIGEELQALYADPGELIKNARVVGMDEIAENDYNLNVPRYVDTFEPEPTIAVQDALAALNHAEQQARQAADQLTTLIRSAGYGV